MRRGFSAPITLLVASASLAVGQEQAQPRIVNEVGGRIRDRTYHAIDDVYTWKVPDLGTRESLTISDRVDNPGITSHVMFKADNGVVATLIVTRIRATLPRDDRVLDRLKSRFKEESNDYKSGYFLYGDFDPERPEDGPSRSPVNGGRFLQSTLLNEQAAFEVDPDQRGYELREDGKIVRVGVRRLFVISGFLYELIVIEPAKPGTSRVEMRKSAERLLISMLEGLSPNPATFNGERPKPADIERALAHIRRPVSGRTHEVDGAKPPEGDKPPR